MVDLPIGPSHPTLFQSLLEWLSWKTFIITLAVLTTGVGLIAIIGYYQILSQNTILVYATTQEIPITSFSSDNPTQINQGDVIVGSAEPNSIVNLKFDLPANDYQASVSVSDDGAWRYQLPVQVDSGSATLEVSITPSNGDTATSDYPVTVETAVVPTLTPSPAPVCRDELIYCQDNRQIWQHEGRADGGSCQYQYTDLGACTLPTLTATGSSSLSPPSQLISPTSSLTPSLSPTTFPMILSPTPTPLLVTLSPSPTPPPTNKTCQPNKIYCSLGFVLQSFSQEANSCSQNLDLVKDRSGKKIKCVCPPPVKYGVCQI